MVVDDFSELMAISIAVFVCAHEYVSVLTYRSPLFSLSFETGSLSEPEIIVACQDPSVSTPLSD